MLRVRNECLPLACRVCSAICHWIEVNELEQTDTSEGAHKWIHARSACCPPPFSVGNGRLGKYGATPDDQFVASVTCRMPNGALECMGKHLVGHSDAQRPRSPGLAGWASTLRTGGWLTLTAAPTRLVTVTLTSFPIEVTATGVETPAVFDWRSKG